MNGAGLFFILLIILVIFVILFIYNTKNNNVNNLKCYNFVNDTSKNARLTIKSSIDNVVLVDVRVKSGESYDYMTDGINLDILFKNRVSDVHTIDLVKYASYGDVTFIIKDDFNLTVNELTGSPSGNYETITYSNTTDSTIFLSSNNTTINAALSFAKLYTIPSGTTITINKTDSSLYTTVFNIINSSYINTEIQYCIGTSACTTSQSSPQTIFFPSGNYTKVEFVISGTAPNFTLTVNPS